MLYFFVMPHEGKTELPTYPLNYVYILYVWSNYSKKDLNATSVAKKCMKL